MSRRDFFGKNILLPVLRLEFRDGFRRQRRTSNLKPEHSDEEAATMYTGREEFAALDNLSRTDDIIILSADKENATLILNITDNRCWTCRTCWILRSTGVSQDMQHELWIEKLIH